MLPKRFPEYIIMHKTLLRQIKELENVKKDIPDEINEIQTKIQKYQKELERIEKMFPEKFFDEE